MPNGRAYVSTRWTLGVVVGLLAMALAGWGKWIQATVTTDHDELIRNIEQLATIDRHITELTVASRAYDDQLSATLQVVLAEHQELMRAIRELSR